MLQVQHTSQWNLLPAWSCFYLYLVIPSGIETSGLCLPPPSWLLHTQFSSVQSLSHVQLFANPWTAAHQASLSITNSWSPPKPMSVESVMPSNHLILCRPILLLPSIPPSIRVFPMCQFLARGGQNPGVSALASFFPKKSQGWSPSEWTGWISLQSKGLSRLFSNTTVQTHQFFGTQLSL